MFFGGIDMQTFLEMKVARQGSIRRSYLVIHDSQESYFKAFTERKRDTFTLIIDGFKRLTYRTLVGINVAYDRGTYDSAKRNKPNFLVEWFQMNKITPSDYVYLNVIEDKEVFELYRHPPKTKDIKIIK